jgi:hypothetical protein
MQIHIATGNDMNNLVNNILYVIEKMNFTNNIVTWTPNLINGSVGIDMKTKMVGNHYYYCNNYFIYKKLIFIKYAYMKNYYIIYCRNKK